MSQELTRLFHPDGEHNSAGTTINSKITRAHVRSKQARNSTAGFGIVGWSPGLRQTVKTLLTVRCKFIVADPGTDLGWACR
jgi:hypothetical protein